MSKLRDSVLKMYAKQEADRTNRKIKEIDPLVIHFAKIIEQRIQEQRFKVISPDRFCFHFFAPRLARCSSFIYFEAMLDKYFGDALQFKVAKIDFWLWCEIRVVIK